MHKMRLRVLEIFASLFFTFLSLNPAYGHDFNVELSLGTGIWGGPWAQAVNDANLPLGLDTKGLIIPTLSAATVWKGPPLFGPVRFNAAAGLGLWSGSLAGYQDGELQRAQSILAFALEAQPRLTAEFPINQGHFIAELGLGFGIALGPVLSIDAFPGFMSVAKTSPDFFRRFFGTAGIGVGFRANGRFSYMMRAEAGIADFGAAPGDGPTWIGRFQASISYALPGKDSL
ncbi:MAG: hypothetical protein CVV47_08470 [Spirochaetae bacterium HGW-Spirochaetae-3]|jgi:hypothetical protein|nr:MAG: hypothetical protein CVV47_08470 [Spirochaetae bacterium HGW-Spirochaetae-3]